MPESSKTINQLLIEAMDRCGTETCLYVKQNRLYQGISYRFFRAAAFRLAFDLQQAGVKPGDRLALIGRNTLEWLVAYVAGHLVGAITVPIRATLAPPMLVDALADCAPVAAVAQGGGLLSLIQEKGARFPSLKTIYVVGEPETGAATVHALSRILATSIPPDVEAGLRTQALEVKADAVSVLHYTTGADGHLMAAMFDQGQEAQTMVNMSEWCPLDEDDLAFTTPSPWSDQPNLNATLHYFVNGVANALADGDETNFSDLQHTSPTLTLTTPYAFEYIYTRVMAEMDLLPRSSQEIFQWALTVGRDYHTAGLNASAELRESYQRADMTFFSTIRGMMGGRLRRFYSVGAPLTRQWIEFAEAIGLLPLDVYSLTKAGGTPAASRPNSRRPGSCGRITPGFTIRIADDGEILVRGDTVMRGYWGHPDETNKVLDADGWLHTGDLGRFDVDGYLYITGHKHAPMILATGRKVFPTVVEDRLARSPYIRQAFVCGEGRRYIAALLVPDFAAIGAQLKTLGHLPLDRPLRVDTPAFMDVIAAEVRRVNATLDGWEQVEQYALLDRPFQDAGGQPIDNVAQNRALIRQQYGEQLESLYPAATPFEEKAVTQVQLEPEHLRQLIEKEDLLDAWMNDAGIGFLVDMARAKQIDGPSMVHICETVAAIAQMQNEERPLSTALIVGNPARIGRILPESALQLRQYDHIRRMRRIVTSLAKIVDGQVLGFSVDRHGFVRGIHRLEAPLEPLGSDLTGTNFRHLAAISAQCDALVLSIPAGGRQVRVFADGQLVGRYVNGSWLTENMVQLDTAVMRLAENKGHSLELLRRLLRCAFKMSERNLGAILLLGDADAILQRSDRSEIQNVASVVNLPIAELSDEELIAYARQDGATVVDARGDLRGCMVLLRPAASTQAQVGPGKGARHSSAAKMSAETYCIAITVSQDGPIAVYESGQRVLSL